MIRRVHSDDWERFRDLRLRALEDAPDAFLSTLEEEQGHSDEDWREWAAASTVFVDEDFTGMAGGFVKEPGVVMLFGMWVAPERRGTGLAEELACAVVDWARELEARRVVLWVMIGNRRAERFYERLGFAPTGVRKAMRNGLDAELALEL